MLKFKNKSTKFDQIYEKVYHGNACRTVCSFSPAICT